MFTRGQVFLGAAFALLIPGIAMANLVTNGGFETGDFTGWTTGANSYPEFLVTSPVHSGTYAAQIAGYSYDPDTLSQTIATTPGETYDLSFWREQDGGAITSLVVTWDGATVFSELNPADQGGPYLNVSVLVAGTGSDTLVFTSANDPGYTFLDDVSVTSATPEPGLYGLLALGLGGLATVVIRMRKTKI